MKRRSETVWTDNDGRVLLRKCESSREYNVIPSLVTTAELSELGIAIVDALQDEPEGALPPWAPAQQ